MPPAKSRTAALPYDPVADYINQRPGFARPKGGELALLKSLSKDEVDALISMDNKSRILPPQQGITPFSIGTVSF